MHDVTFRQHFEGLDDLPEITESFLFWEGTFFLHEFVESASVAELVDEVEVVGSFEHVYVLDDVGTGGEARKDVDLVDCAFLEFGDLPELFSLNYLDGHFLLGDHVDCLVDLCVDSLSQLLL